MLIRAIALSLALLVGMGTIVPFMTDSTEAGPRHKHKKHKKLKKYSKAWWRWYHKQQRKKRALLARKRALRAKQILLARQKSARDKQAPEQAQAPKFTKKGDVREVHEDGTRERVAIRDTPPTLPTGKKAPKSFKQTEATNSELDFQVSDDSGNRLGRASLTVFAPAQGEDGGKMIAGIPTNNLRREVINRMMKEDGWVVNDYQKTVNGKKVYVVVAQSSVKGVVQSRQFYFTEVNGKVYTLATTSSNDVQDVVAKESEKVIQSLQNGNRPTSASNK